MLLLTPMPGLELSSVAMVMKMRVCTDEVVCQAKMLRLMRGGLVDGEEGASRCCGDLMRESGSTGGCNGVGAESGSSEACDAVGCICAHAAALEEVEGVGEDDGVTSVTLSGRGEEGWLWS